MVNLYEQIDANKRKTVIITVLFIIFISFVGWIFSEASGYGFSFLPFALLLSSGSALASYYWGDKFILSLSSAHQADKNKDKLFYQATENLCLGAGLPMPHLYIIEDTATNAFATGRDPQHAIVCITRGLLDKLDRSELEGVIAHELSHIKNYDMRLMTIVAILVGTIALLADWFNRQMWFGDRRRNQTIIMIIALVMAIFAPIIGSLMQLALSRKREFLADASAAGITRYPEGLAKALEKISADKEPLEAANRATASLYIVNPLREQKFVGWFVNLFNTHPPIAERIKLLRNM